MNEILKRDENHEPVVGLVTDDSNQFIKMGRIDDTTKGMKVMLVGGAGMGTVTEIDTGTGLTGGPITTVGTISLATNIAPIATLGSALQSIRVNAGATALEYYTPSSTGLVVGTTTITSGTTTRILYNNAGVLGEYTLTGTGTVVVMATAPTISGHPTIEGITSTGATGTGNFVFATSPTLTTAVLGSSTATTQTPGTNNTTLATTAFVAAAVLGQNFKEAAKYATTTALPTVVYSNGSSGVGATLIAVGLGALSLDGNTPSVNDRVLVKNQVSTFQNSIYSVTTVGNAGVAFVLTRTTDANQGSEYETGDSLFVTAGTTQATTTWAYTGIDNPTIGTDAITYVQTAGQGSFISGNGITITGNSIAIDTSVTVDKTTAQNLTNKTLTSPTLTTPILGTPSSGTLTSCTGLPASSVVAGTFGTGSYTMDTQLTVKQIVNTSNAITASANAATVPITSRISTVTNNSAAGLTITLTTTSAVDGQMIIVRSLPSSAVAQTITWVNTENSDVTPSANLNASTTSPRTDGFQYNSVTSKWRCLASC